MAANRMPHRAATALIASLLMVVAGSRASLGYTGSETPGAAGPFVNPFPAAGSAPTEPAAGALAPPNYQYEGTLPLVMGGLPTPGFTITPMLSIQEMFNDNIFQTETDRRADFVTLITPSLSIGANTPRLNLTLAYAPTYQYYARNPSENGFIHQMFGVASLEVVPDTLFVNGRVFATVAPTNGGVIGGGFGVPLTSGTALGTGPLTLSSQGRTQIFGASVSPYLVHRFGEYGTGTLGLTLDETYSSDSVDSGGSSRFSTVDATGQFQTGSYFGRVQDTVTLNANRTTGTGVLDGARQESAVNQLGYALNAQWQVFGRLGWENIIYGGTPSTHINDAVWGAGVTYTPNADSSITLSYDHQDGISGFQALAHYAITPRTMLTASYSHSLQTNLQYVSTQLAQAAVGPNGQPILGPNGAPLVLVYSALGVQDTLYQTDTLAVGMTTLLDRDTISLSVDRVNEEPISSGGNTNPGLAQELTTGTVSWARALNERATLSASFSYGSGSLGTAGGWEDLISAALGYIYRISPTLTGSASYQYYRRNSTIAGDSMYVNVVLVGITKQF